MSYNRDIDDVRESPALDVMHLLRERGGLISYTDPHVPEIQLDDETLRTQPCDAVRASDCVVIVTDHAAFDYKKLLEQASLIVDTRNAMKGVVSEKVVRL